MKIGWFSKILKAISTWFTRKQEPKKLSQPNEESEVEVAILPEYFPKFMPDQNYANWYRKTFLRPRRKRRF